MCESSISAGYSYSGEAKRKRRGSDQGNAAGGGIGYRGCATAPNPPVCANAGRMGGMTVPSMADSAAAASAGRDADECDDGGGGMA